MENTDAANTLNVVNKSVQPVKPQIVLLSHMPKFPPNLVNNVITMPDGRKGLLLPPTNAILNSSPDAAAFAEKVIFASLCRFPNLGYFSSQREDITLGKLLKRKN